jgi:hypothetical protein
MNNDGYFNIGGAGAGYYLERLEAWCEYITELRGEGLEEGTKCYECRQERYYPGR